MWEANIKALLLLSLFAIAGLAQPHDDKHPVKDRQSQEDLSIAPDRS
jgi:hypothetical protein